MEIFKITGWKALLYLVWPLVMLIILLGISFGMTSDLSVFTDMLWLGISSFFFLYSTVPTVILLINHFVYFRRTTFGYDVLSQQLYYSNGPTSIAFNKSDIISITSFNALTGKIPWSDIYIWELKLADKTITLSQIVIRKTDFTRVFADKIVQKKHKFFVSLK